MLVGNTLSKDIGIDRYIIKSLALKKSNLLQRNSLLSYSSCNANWRIPKLILKTYTMLKLNNN